MTGRPDDDELLKLLSTAFDADLPPVPAPLSDQARALRPDPAAGATGDELAVRRHRIDRELAAAAGNGSRRLREQFVSADQVVVTEVEENEESHLVVTVRTADQDVLYVALAWTLVDVEGVGSSVRLLTPLALDRAGAAVRYDIGALGDTGTIYVEPARAVPLTEVTAPALHQGLSLVQTGLSRRAWLRAEASHSALGDVLADLIRTRLEP